MNILPWKKPGFLSTSGGDLVALRDEMDRTVERLLNQPFGFIEPKMLRSEGWLPPMDVSETDTELLIRAEVPGIAPKDVNVSVTGNMLTIAGEKEESCEKKGENFFRSERRFGSFRRLVELPETIDPDRVTAETDNGVVTIRLAKKPGVKPRQVEIKPSNKTVPVTA